MRNFLIFICSFLSVAALNFTSGTTDKVNCGSGSSVDNLTTYTLMAWIYPTTLTPASLGPIMQKSTAGTRRQAYLSTVGVGFGSEVGRATTALQTQAVAANFSAAAANTWLFYATRVNTGGVDGDQEIYIGSQTAALAEPSAYVVQAVGSGTVGDDSADNLIVGGHPSSALAFPGRIGWFGIVNSYLSYNDMEKYRTGTRGPSAFQIFMWLGLHGTGNQFDLSGNGNHGTITGATQADGPPQILTDWGASRRIWK